MFFLCAETTDLTSYKNSQFQRSLSIRARPVNKIPFLYDSIGIDTFESSLFVFHLGRFFNMFVYFEYLVMLLHSLVCRRWAFGIVLWEICTLGEFSFNRYF